MCWSDFYSEMVVGQFSHYVQRVLHENQETLEKYIHLWLIEGNGASATGGDYTAFLQATLIIIDAYEKDPSMLDFVGNAEHPPFERPRVSRVLDLQPWGSECFDPHVYRGYANGDYT